MFYRSAIAAAVAAVLSMTLVGAQAHDDTSRSARRAISSARRAFWCRPARISRRPICAISGKRRS